MWMPLELRGPRREGRVPCGSKLMPTAVRLDLCKKPMRAIIYMARSQSMCLSQAVEGTVKPWGGIDADKITFP
jgi:hypothetical protein